jgi:hypothetical protein
MSKLQASFAFPISYRLPNNSYASGYQKNSAHSMLQNGRNREH